jgi:hypothetical protein
MFLYSNETCSSAHPVAASYQAVQSQQEPHLHLQLAIKCDCTVTKITVKCFASCSYVFRLSTCQNSAWIQLQVQWFTSSLGYVAQRLTVWATVAYGTSFLCSLVCWQSHTTRVLLFASPKLNKRVASLQERKTWLLDQRTYWQPLCSLRSESALESRQHTEVATMGDLLSYFFMIYFAL